MYTILAQAMPNQTIMTVLLYVGIIGVFWFFMIRPQQKKRKDQQSFIENLKNGDAVSTIGGVHGRIVSVDELTVTLEVDRGVKMVFDKTAISREVTAKVPEKAV
ncbi:MAG: preprotein translocase subunit YajC [Rudanella sp.]|nr:preprotein translocase subunit YajC [Rudanella sp.]